MHDLETEVIKALDNARDNGYDMSVFEPVEIAEDLIRFNQDFEDFETIQLTPHIKTWLQKSP